MELHKKIFDLLDYSGKSQTEFARSIKTQPQVITNWKARGSTPPAELMPAIAEFFNISIAELFDSNYVPTISANNLDQDESDLVFTYRQLNNLGKSKLMGYTTGLAENEIYIKK